jgi:hypothetical protein
MSALGATTNDLTSLMSLQAAMVEQGVPPELILETLKLILSSQGPDSGIPTLNIQILSFVFTGDFTARGFSNTN